MPEDLENKFEIGWNKSFAWEKQEAKRLSWLYRQRVYALIATAWIAIWGVLWNQCIKTKCDINGVFSQYNSKSGAYFPDWNEEDIFLISVFAWIEILK